MKRLKKTVCNIIVITAIIYCIGTTDLYGKPNVIFILSDDLGYGDLGCYDQDKIQTPNIDKLAEEGVRFTDFYAGCTISAPSRSSLMTGTNVGHTRIRGNFPQVPLFPEDVTLGEIAKEAGYTTAAIGKWGCGEPHQPIGHPNNQGFDYFIGYLNQAHAHDYYTDYLFRDTVRITISENQNGAEGLYTHDLFTDEAIQFIDNNNDKPFFLYLAWTIPHANTYGGTMPVPSLEPYQNESWPGVQRNLAAMITRMDTDVGEIMARLEHWGIDDSTIVFFTSDNGPHQEGGNDPYYFDSNGPLNGIKRSMHDGGIRVPMIVRWPGKIEAGHVSNQPWAFQDVLPTLADLVNVSPPAGIDGKSFLPEILGQTQTPHDHIYWEFYEGAFSQALRMGNWKAVRYDLGAVELYNLTNDIDESNNIASSNAAIANQIQQIMDSEHTFTEFWPCELDPEPNHLAYKKPATAQSHQDIWTADKAVDRNGHQQAWHAAPYPQWWRVDLQAVYSVNRILIRNWVEGNRYYRYNIEYSTNGSNWTKIIEKTNNNPVTLEGDFYSFNEIDARYFRVNMTYNSANNGVHIADFQVYEKGATILSKPAIVPKGDFSSAQIIIRDIHQQRITVSVPQSDNYRILLYSVDGKMQKQVLNNWLSKGTHTIKWHGEELSKGLFIIKVLSKDSTKVKKFVVH